MRLLVLGASGGVGRWLTSLAAKDGHQVTALVRQETAFDPPPGVRALSEIRGHRYVRHCTSPSSARERSLERSKD